MSGPRRPGPQPVNGLPTGSATAFDHGRPQKERKHNMRILLRICSVRGIGQLAALFLAATLLPLGAQEPAQLPSVSGHLTLMNLLTNQNIGLSIEAQIVQQGVLLMPTGTVITDVPEVGPVVFEVTSLELARLEYDGLIVATEAAITAVDRASELTLEVTLYDEDPVVAAQFPGDYHHPFMPGDCVTRLTMGETQYQAACLHLLHSNLEIKSPAAP